MLQAWLWLMLGIALEVSGTVCMKFSESFTRFWPSLFIFLFYAGAMASVTLALKRIDLSMAYAIWAGVGTALVAVIGVLVFKEAATAFKLAGITLIIAGVMLLHVSSRVG